MKVEVCGIWLKDYAGNLVPRIYYGIRAQFANFLFSERNFNIVRCLLSRGQPLQIYNLIKHSGKEVRKFIREERLKSFLACPIIVQGRSIGVIAVCSRDRHRTFTGFERMMFSSIAHEVALSLRNENLSERVKADYLNTIKTIAYILEANDEYTFGHSDKVMKHATSVCRMMRIDQHELDHVKNAALLHDVGKIGIDREILKKQGKLSIRDWEQIKQHPVIGATIIEQTGFLNELAPVIEHHHEQFGGGGYPDPELTQQQIPLGSRIIAVADSYDAMTSPRPYRDHALTPYVAVDELKRNAGKQFDPELVAIFERYIQNLVG
jgi:putative nucleotidyltransferase with HDIG domain